MEDKESKRRDRSHYQQANPSIMPNADEKPRRKREQSEEPNSTGWMSSNSQEATDPEERTASQNANRFFEEDEIILIPDLDEAGGVEADQRVVHAPRNTNRKVPTLIELENDAKLNATSDEMGVDISVLSRILVPQSFVLEDDASWSFEYLLRVVYSEMSENQEMIDAVFDYQT